MKILVFTTLYDMEVRPDLEQDTSSVHYLLKYLARDNEILVINTYINKRGQLGRYLHPHNLIQFFRDYRYVKDGITVHLFETQVVTGEKFHAIEWNWMESRSRQILQQEQFIPDLVISHYPSYSYGFIDKLGFTCPKVAVLHFTDLHYTEIRPSFIDGLRQSFDAAFCRSENILKFFKKYDLPNLRDDIIYSGTILPKKVLDKKITEKVTIIYAGKLIARKKVDWIIECIRDECLEGCSLWIAGNGPEENKLKKLAADLNVENKVDFLGQVSREKVQELMNEATIFCMPSVDETFGLVYLEAMACGCLTIGTKGEGIDGVIIDGENGFLVSTKEELLACLKNIVSKDNIQKMEEISKRAVERGQEFSEENISRRYLKIMKRVIGNDID